MDARTSQSLGRNLNRIGPERKYLNRTGPERKKLNRNKTERILNRGGEERRGAYGLPAKGAVYAPVFMNTQEDFGAKVKKRWDAVAKPLDGLGRLERLVIKIGALTQTDEVKLTRRVVCVMCSDNGVVEEGVTQTDASVTAIQAENILHHRTSVCRMAAVAGADVFPVDMGMLVRVPGVDGPHIADGTGNIARGPAMSREECQAAVDYGKMLAGKYKQEGYDIIVTGEMGIGNTTTSSAVASVLLSVPVESVTGRGAGLSDEGLAKKIRAVRHAIEVNKPDPADPMDVLARLGGFDIAGMTGLFLGAYENRIPVVIDGLISSIAALIAVRLCPEAASAMLPSHSSAEPAAEAILAEIGEPALLYAGMKLGEGTGAVCMLPLLDMALSVYESGVGFTDTGLEPYTVQKGDRR